ncbi:MAG: RNA polymerase sigma-54 factor, partial [Alphaproteobacteria bacterium]
MANGPSMRQELRQSQSLVMTQQLQQSIKLLQLSAGELQEFIDEELEKNPLLQREDAEGAPVESQEPSEDAPLTASERDAAERKEIDVSGEDFSVNESLYDEDFAGDWNDEAQTDFGRHSAETHSQGSGRHFDPDAEGSN